MKSPLKHIADVLNAMPPGAKATARAVAVVVFFVFGAVLEGRIQLIFSEDEKQIIEGIVWLGVIACATVLYALVHYAYLSWVIRKENTRKEEQLAIQGARERLVNLYRNQLVDCDRLVENVEKTGSVSAEEFRRALICDLSRIDEIIGIIWDEVNSKHNTSVHETERINFEVTLITASQKDSLLTIAGWKNKDLTRPKSLLAREGDNPGIYDKTEAAKMIRDGIINTRVISDTAKPEHNYEQLYADQKTRIRSSVLHPVRAPTSKVIGVLVLHCEKPGFFKEDDQPYWSAFFSIFAPAIALELERVDAYNKAVHTWTKSTQFPPYTPF